jgi:hypothetical protein
MKTLLIFLVIISVPLACVARLPEAARDLAISALCDYPIFSGRNLCQSVSITRILTGPLEPEIDGGTQTSRHWCIEMKFVDYTGENGSAVVWLMGPLQQGGFTLEDGPLYDQHCRLIH